MVDDILKYALDHGPAKLCINDDMAENVSDEELGIADLVLNSRISQQAATMNCENFEAGLSDGLSDS